MKQANQRRDEARSSIPLMGDWLLLTTDEPLLPPCIENSQSRMERMMQMRNAIIDIDKKLNSKKTLSPQTIVRYEGVKSFMKRQRVVMVEVSRRSIAYTVAPSFGKGWYFAPKLVTWELMVLRGLDILERKLLEKGTCAISIDWTSLSDDPQ
jgi:hypothetical protein